MSDAGLVARQTAFTVVGFRRNSRALVFTVLMPIVLLVLFASVFGGNDQTTKFAGLTITVDAYYTAGIAAYSIMLAGFSTLMISTVTARERGLLKRYRGTPMPPWVFLTTQILQSMLTIVIMVVVLLVIGRVAYDVQVRVGWRLPVRGVPAGRLGDDVHARPRGARGWPPRSTPRPPSGRSAP